MSFGAGALLGLLVGLRHAFEPDHLTAMATLVADARSRGALSHDARRGAVLGAIWGLGHTLALVAVGLVLIAVGDGLPERIAVAFELAVGGVLVLLGVRAIRVALREGRQGPATHHVHGRRRDVMHHHEGPLEHVHLGRVTLAWRPLAVGLVHGLAGSGALTALVFAQLASTGDRLAYIALFGIGSIAGMAAVSAVASASLHGLSVTTRRTLTFAAGLVSIVLGIAWSVPLYAQLA